MAGRRTPLGAYRARRGRCEWPLTITSPRRQPPSGRSARSGFEIASSSSPWCTKKRAMPETSTTRFGRLCWGVHLQDERWSGRDWAHDRHTNAAATAFTRRSPSPVQPFRNHLMAITKAIFHNLAVRPVVIISSNDETRCHRFKQLGNLINAQPIGAVGDIT